MSKGERDTLNGLVFDVTHEPTNKQSPKYEARPPGHELSAGSQDTTTEPFEKISVPGAIAGLREGQCIGRFTILKQLGHGGMGVVVAAYDATLDRRVAVKVLPAHAWGEEAQTGRKRLLREAQAMARLSHPNVVGVHEVGSLGDQVFVAMEYVDGPTLSSWMVEKTRSWREVVDMFVSAGRGLAAAHNAELVHRDFKPDNVLIDKEGRARVTDFGLAQVEGTTVVAVGELLSDDTPLPPSSSALTRRSRRVGTPAFMAPEQHLGGAVDARSDQFSFCVALYRALYGQPPFAGTRYTEFARNVTRGRRQSAPTDSDVPGWVGEILDRGLQTEPDARYPSMNALLRQLSADPAAARRRLIVISGIVAAFLGVAAIAVFGLLRSSTPARPQCDGGRAKIEQVWNKQAGTQIGQAFSATKLRYAHGAQTSVAAALTLYATQWVAARTDACEATHVRGEQSESLLDLRIQCLDRRLGEMRALVGLFVDKPDRSVVGGAVRAATSLTDVLVCADVASLTAAAPPHGSLAMTAAIRAARTKLDQIVVFGYTGKFKIVHKRLLAMESQVREIGHQALLSEFLYHKGAAEFRVAPKRAQATLLAASRAAASAHQDRWLARIQSKLVWLLISLGRTDAALTLARAGEATVVRAGNPGQLRARWLQALGRALGQSGKVEEAQKRLEESLALRKQHAGAQQFDIAWLLNTIAGLHQRRGEHAKARARYEESLKIAEALLGREHPNVAVTRGNLCHSMVIAGSYNSAGSCYKGAIKILSDANGADSPEVAWALNDLGVLLSTQRRFGEAQRTLERALKIWIKTVGAKHSDVAWTLNSLGELALLKGDAPQALRRCLHAQRIRTALRPAPATEDAYHLACIGRAYLRLSKPVLAVEALEQAMKLVAKIATDPEIGAATRFALARLLWPKKDARPRALRLAREARTGFKKVGKSTRVELRQVIDWLAAHRLVAEKRR